VIQPTLFGRLITLYTKLILVNALLTKHAFYSVGWITLYTKLILVYALLTNQRWKVVDSWLLEFRLQLKLNKVGSAHDTYFIWAS
jgi:hypothetical protein